MTNQQLIAKCDAMLRRIAVIKAAWAAEKRAETAMTLSQPKQKETTER